MDIVVLAAATLGPATVAWVVAMAVLEAVSAASGVAQVGSESEIGMVDPAPATPGWVPGMRVVTTASKTNPV